MTGDIARKWITKIKDGVMMEAARLKEYLGMIVNLEQMNYIQEKEIRRMENIISDLGYARKLTPPEEPEKNYRTWEVGSCMIMGFLCGGFGLAVSDTFLLRLLTVPAMIIAFLLIVVAIVNSVQASNANAAAAERYKQEKEKFENDLVDEAIRLDREDRQKALMQAQLNSLKGANRKTKGTLRQMYDANIIHEKYRGLIPICSLYGYFDTGVCDKLEGHEGAYNKYDTESRLDYIICKLDEVIKHLEEIKSNQHQLYVTIKDSNAKLDRLNESNRKMLRQMASIQDQGAELNARIERMQSTSDLALFEAACSREQLSYINRMSQWGY